MTNIETPAGSDFPTFLKVFASPGYPKSNECYVLYFVIHNHSTLYVYQLTIDNFSA